MNTFPPRGGGVCDQDLTRSGTCSEHVFAEIADRNVISVTRHTKMARATPNYAKAVRKETKLKYELKPELKLHHPTPIKRMMTLIVTLLIF